MMKYILLTMLLLLVGCIHNKPSLSVDDTNVTRSLEYQQEIDQLLSIDKKNKLLEEVYLKEITIAQDNDDHDAYKFFIVEYVKIPRIPLPSWVKQEPGYYARKSAAEVMREYRSTRLE